MVCIEPTNSELGFHGLLGFRPLLSTKGLPWNDRNWRTRSRLTRRARAISILLWRQSIASTLIFRSASWLKRRPSTARYRYL